jgi:6-phosphogluconolactonase/glucosamine-6-phosphate isomerase/deaminase
MRFIYCEGTDRGIADISERLTAELAADRRVLWLVCGGSNIVAEVAIMRNVPAELSANLTVTLTDERYGEVGHADSNWQQLLTAGFDIKAGKALPVLGGESLERTTTDYAALAERALEAADLAVVVFGIGGDGHIAGILPDSPAAHQSAELAAGYDSPPYTRLTLTFPALRRLDVAYALAFGDAKRAALQRLKTEDLELAEQPSQILKQLPEAYLYSDQIGGKS